MIIDNIYEGDFKQSNDVYDTGIALTLVFTPTEVAQLLTEYDAAVSTSPGVTTCRPIVRAICAKLVEHTGTGNV